MGNRIFVAVVLLLWASTMSWLVVEKILPPFLSGDPPTHGVLRETQPVCWQIECAGRNVGYAVRQAVPGALSTTEIHSRVILEDMPLKEMAPQWMSSLVDNLGKIRLDSRTRLTLDSFGTLSTFETRVQVNDLPLVVKVYGKVEGPELNLKFLSGGVSQEWKFPFPASNRLDGELIPEPKLLQAYVGRKWQVEMFSLFRPPSDSLTLLQAEVVAEETIRQHEQVIRARRIEFRDLSAAGVAAEHTLRAALWVGEDGTVLRQDVFLVSNNKLRFERRSDDKAIRLAKELLDLETVATLTTPRN
ncbi:MAG: hypothetical protein AB7G28_23960 [Pirellulales bacterium]